MFAAPEPHPLDYDWRYTPETVSALCDLLPERGRILAVGAPSVARQLESLGRKVTLVDRQPLQGVREHSATEIARNGLAARDCAAALVDPPWYSIDFRRWTAWAAQLVGCEGHVIVSLWPDGTRPGDAEEAQRVRTWISDWAEVELLSLVPRYEKPLFERAAVRVSDDGLLASSPGAGRLLRLYVKRRPEIPPKDRKEKLWLRFVLDDYQLALRFDEEETGPPSIRQHHHAKGWVWPYVSKRAPERDAIGLWSSHNEAAIVQNGSQLAEVLRCAFAASNARSFERLLTSYPDLLAWDIPRPPYRRFLEWQHQQ